MKTHNGHFFNIKSLQVLCESLLQYSLTTGSAGLHFLLCCLWAQPSPAHSQVKKQSNWNVLANLEAVSLAWIATVKSTTQNNRQYIAFVIFCASPFAFSLHAMFDRKVVYEWMGFIQNWYHLLNLIGPYLWALVVLTGCSLLIVPTGKAFKIFKRPVKVHVNRLLSVPIGICIAKIIWLSTITSNEEFWALPNYGYFSIGIFIAYFYYRLLEYFTWRKFHAYDGIIASLEGLYNSDLDHETRREKGAPLWSELKGFQTKY